MVTRSLAVIISSILTGHYSTRAVGRPAFRSGGDALGNFHSLPRGVTDRFQPGVVDIGGLGRHLRKSDRAAARNIFLLRIIPFPDCARGGGLLDEGLGRGRFLTVGGEGPAISGYAQMGDAADAVAVLMLLAQYVEYLLAV